MKIKERYNKSNRKEDNKNVRLLVTAISGKQKYNIIYNNDRK